MDSMWAGQERWNVCEKHYISDMQFKMHLFDTDGHVLLSRSEWNQRKLASAVNTYSKMFLEHGVLVQMRGRFMCQPDATDPRPLARRLLGGATVIEGIYLAISKFPDNKYCKLVLAGGISAIWT